MKLVNEHSDSAVLKEIGRRIAHYRLNQNKTQAALAQEAGVSHRTITRVEHGDSIQASSLIRILRALQLVENFEALVPATSPVQQFKMQGKQRHRASSKSVKPTNKESWSWGDEE